MWYHLRSFFLSSCAMINVVFSFFVTLLLYRTFIGYFADLHRLCIFVVLGVAADDVFVYTDAWKQSRQIPEIMEDPYAQMEYTQRRASKTIFITSATSKSFRPLTHYSCRCFPSNWILRHYADCRLRNLLGHHHSGELLHCNHSIPCSAEHLGKISLASIMLLLLSFKEPS